MLIATLIFTAYCVGHRKGYEKGRNGIVVEKKDIPKNIRQEDILEANPC